MMIRVLFVFFCFLLFYWILGYYQERLTNTLIPVIHLFVARGSRTKNHGEENDL